MYLCDDWGFCLNSTKDEMYLHHNLKLKRTFFLGLFYLRNEIEREH